MSTMKLGKGIWERPGRPERGDRSLSHQEKNVKEALSDIQDEVR
jgi:hypothetical protein